MRLEGAAFRNMLTRHYSFLIGIPTISVLLGWQLERLEANRMSRFRDKSALYGRKMAHDEPPSWP